MSLITDLRAVSENAVEQIAARFTDLPRPLLAAIGAGDLAVRSLAELRESLADSVGDRVSAGSPVDVTDVRSAVADLSGRAQRVAADVAGSIEQFAADAPARAQELIGQLPGRLAEFQSVAQSLSPDTVRETVESYTQLVGMIYGNFAVRGDRTWSKVRAAGIRPGAVVDAVADTARPVAPGPAAPGSASPRPATAKPTATDPAAARAKAAAAKATAAAAKATAGAAKATAKAGGPAAAHPKVAARPATPRSTATPATPKSTAAPATPRSTAKPATPRSTAKPGVPESLTEAETAVPTTPVPPTSIPPTASD